MTPPTIKKVSANGQVVLPSRYKNHHVTMQETENGLSLKLLVWDEDLQIWLSPDDAEQKDIMESETIWGRNTSKESFGEFKELLDQSIKNDG